MSTKALLELLSLASLLMLASALSLPVLHPFHSSSLSSSSHSSHSSPSSSSPSSLADPSPPWRTSLNVCWTNISCDRALIVSHGGAWTAQYPYDSFPAMQRAYNLTSDAVKGDFRVSKDNIGMVTHSSPIEFYESPMCTGKKIEDMLAADIEKCKMALTSYTFISVPELLAWAEGKVVVMLCVKESRDIARAITTLIENNATDRAFLEIKVGDMISVVPTLPQYEQVYYLAEGNSAADADAIFSFPALSRVFTFEFDPTYPSWGVNITNTIARFHARGIRTLTATSKDLPSVHEQEQLWRDGFDVVYTYDTENAITARTAIDRERGVLPP